ncbi:hypothetical protein SGCOL_009161 [Colletotrichum sp. CLE4]
MNPKPAIPKGSLVLVTGATGHIAAHTTKQFLERGLKVRGTVRILGRAKRLIQGVIAAFAERGDLELVHVPDLGAKHIFDEAIKGVSAIAHIAWILSFSDDPCHSVAAKKHTELHCITASGSGQFIVSFPNNDVTRKTCPGFCSDCFLSNSGTTITCKSSGKLMEGGDFSDACIKNDGSGGE